MFVTDEDIQKLAKQDENKIQEQKDVKTLLEEIKKLEQSKKDLEWKVKRVEEMPLFKESKEIEQQKLRLVQDRENLNFDKQLFNREKDDFRIREAESKAAMAERIADAYREVSLSFAPNGSSVPMSIKQLNDPNARYNDRYNNR